MAKDIFQKWIEEGIMTETELEFHRTCARLNDCALYGDCTAEEESELYNNYIVLEMLMLIEKAALNCDIREF